MSGPRLAIVGSGAGSTNIGVDLVQAGADVTFFDPWRMSRQYGKDGARIVMPRETIVQPIKAHPHCDMATFNEPFDYAFVALKARCPLGGGTGQSAFEVRRSDGGGPERHDRRRGFRHRRTGRSLGCVLEIRPPLRSRHDRPRLAADRSWFAVGRLDDGAKGREREVADMLKHAGVTEVMDDILSAKWMKLVNNSTASSPPACLG